MEELVKGKKINLMETASKANACCPVYKFACLVESKWSMIILRDLFLRGPSRFKDFKINTPTLTDRALNQTLKRLQILRLIERKVENTTPLTVTYELSKYGKNLQPVFEAMIRWGKGEKKENRKTKK